MQSVRQLEQSGLILEHRAPQILSVVQVSVDSYKLFTVYKTNYSGVGLPPFTMFAETPNAYTPLSSETKESIETSLTISPPRAETNADINPAKSAEVLALPFTTTLPCEIFTSENETSCGII